jgi:hypothetical protein
VLFKNLMMSCKRLMRILKCNLMLFDQVPLLIPLVISIDLKRPQATVVIDAITWILMLFVLKVNILMLRKYL